MISTVLLLGIRCVADVEGSRGCSCDEWCGFVGALFSMILLNIKGFNLCAELSAYRFQLLDSRVNRVKGFRIRF